MATDTQLISKEVTVTGLATIDKRLEALDAKLTRKIVVKALREGAKVTQRAAIATMPVLTGKGRASIKVRAGKRRKGLVSMRVGVGKQWFVGDEFYLAFLEFGHRLGSRKLGPSRWLVPGEHPIEYAWDESKHAAVGVIFSTIKTLLEQAEREVANDNLSAGAE